MPIGNIRKTDRVGQNGIVLERNKKAVEDLVEKMRGSVNNMTKVVKAITVRRNDSMESYRVGEEIGVMIGETRHKATINHIDKIVNVDDNKITHTHYDVYAKTDEGELFHVVTVTDMPVEIEYGYRPF